MSGHTPGPWAVNEWSGGWTVYGGRMPLATGVEVARIAPVDDERERNEADARLIAAAPDLLAACEALLGEFAEHDPYHPKVLAAEAAIAKARGTK